MTPETDKALDTDEDFLERMERMAGVLSSVNPAYQRLLDLARRGLESQARIEALEIELNLAAVELRCWHDEHSHDVSTEGLALQYRIKALLGKEG